MFRSVLKENLFVIGFAPNLQEKLTSEKPFFVSHATDFFFKLFASVLTAVKFKLHWYTNWQLKVTNFGTFSPTL
jgi:hypothetical protein